ncbi:MAG: GDYXXLXY domain-containing protein [SAR202 cluster bacterium]|nr:GDYXXLXY domain-containing protein [SAR202 cluster bacterium]
MSLYMKIAFWATVAGQIILLLAFVAYKENTLRSGTSVLLQTVPIDPRSVLQGDYAILDYEIAELPDSVVFSTGQRFYIRLIERQDGVWGAGGYYTEKPDSDDVFIRGTVKPGGRLEFGIDTFFVPEGTGQIIERASDVKVRVAVSSGGSAVIEELLVDGEPFDPRDSKAPDEPAKEPPPVAPAATPSLAPK